MLELVTWKSEKKKKKKKWFTSFLFLSIKILASKGN